MSIISRLKDQVSDYIDVYVRLFKLNFIQRTAGVLSYLMFALITLFLVFCIVLFLGFGITEIFILAGLSKMLSFFITVGIYLLSLFILMAYRRKITRFFAGGIINVMTENDEHEEDEKTGEKSK